MFTAPDAHMHTSTQLHIMSIRPEKKGKKKRGKKAVSAYLLVKNSKGCGVDGGVDYEHTTREEGEEKKREKSSQCLSYKEQ